jgi:hypothetical protein
MYLWNMNIEKDYIKLFWTETQARTNKNLSLFA